MQALVDVTPFTILKSYIPGGEDKNFIVIY